MTTPRPTPAHRLRSVLAFIHANLDQDLALARLAARVRLSPHHFHRLFRDVVGETVKQYTQRVRLEDAARRLVLQSDTVLDIALACGYDNHETFSRAFRRQFAVSPRQFRRAPAIAGQPGGRDSAAGSGEGHPCQLSAVRFCSFGPITVACMRHVGPYEAVSDALWPALTRRLRARRRLPPATAYFGIARDAPGITPAARLRFDAAVLCRPFDDDGDDMFCETLPATTCAAIRHIGSFSTLGAAYRRAVDHVRRSRRYQLVGLPAIEAYAQLPVAGAVLNQTDVYLPVRPR